MASIRKRGDRWQVQVRRSGFAPVSRSFLQKADAQVWARQIEANQDRGEVSAIARVSDQRTTVLDLLDRYGREITPRKKSADRERHFIAIWKRLPLARYSASKVRSEAIWAAQQVLALRLKPASVSRLLALLQHVFEVARRDWGLPLPANPVKAVPRPRLANQRERRLGEGELEALLRGAERGRVPQICPLIVLAVETAMRRGELLAIRWEQIDWDRSTLAIPVTKTGYPRTIPLTPLAKATLLALSNGGGSPSPLQSCNRANAGPFVGWSPNAVRLAWERLCRRVGVEDLHFHDLRHEAISRFFEKGLSVPEVALISGHRDYRMLARYTHLKAEVVAKKLLPNSK